MSHFDEYPHLVLWDVSVRAQALLCSTFLLFFPLPVSLQIGLLTTNQELRFANSPLQHSSNRYYICREVSETDSLFAGRIISTAWGQAQQ